MSRAIFIIILNLFFLEAFGQNHEFQIGLKGGPSHVYLRGQQYLDDSHEPDIRYISGLSFQFNLPHYFSFETGLYYNQKGSKAVRSFFDENQGTQSQTTTQNYFDYITLPILARVAWGKKVSFSMSFGYYASYLTKMVSEVDYQYKPDISVEQKDIFNEFDMGLTGGLGLGYNLLENWQISLEIRHEAGLSNLVESPIVHNGTIKTNATHMLLGVAYKLKPRASE